MPITITMPALSPTMTEGKIATWQVKEGDRVSAGDVIAEIETDKATMEVEAVDEGTLGRILIPAGTENVAVNTPIAILLETGEDASVLDGYQAAGEPAAAAAPAPAAPAEKPAPAPAAAATVERISAAPESEGVKVEAARTARVADDPAPVTPAGERIFASPLARRLAAEAGLDLARIAGTGPHGRIIKADVEAAIRSGTAAVPKPVQEAAPAAPAAVAAPVAAPAQAAVTPPPAGDYIEVPLTSMRRTIARRLTESKQTIPHFYLTVDCEIDKLLAMRKELNARSDDYKLSVNDFVIRAAALALRKVPEANACWGGDKILQYRDIDISVAVALEGGLITPVLRKADQKGLAVISNEMKDLAERARAQKLMPEEYQGGCFSISNLGMYGIREFAAVINPPQAAILAVGVGEMRPVVRNGAIAMATLMTVTLSCDHRVIDGARGAQLLNYFKGYIEEPLTMLL